MNIFVLDTDPVQAARSQCDAHVVKMVLETAQILSSVHHLQSGGLHPWDVYKLTHRNHPCSVWARQHTGNYDWLVRHGLALAAEYTHRYGKRHKSQDVVELCGQYRPETLPVGVSPFAQAMPAAYQRADAVAAYRAYYSSKREQFAMRWTRRPVPAWWNSFVEDCSSAE